MAKHEKDHNINADRLVKNMFDDFGNFVFKTIFGKYFLKAQTSEECHKKSGFRRAKYNTIYSCKYDCSYSLYTCSSDVWQEKVV